VISYRTMDDAYHAGWQAGLAVRLEKLQLRNGDVIIVRGDTYQVTSGVVSQLAMVKVPTAPHPLVMALHGVEVEKFSETEMALHGWVRKEKTDG
jgi:hypothetical protein